MAKPSVLPSVHKLTLLLTAAFLAVGCPTKKPETPVGHGPDASLPRPVVSARGFRVSDADDDGQGQPTKPVATTPMSDAETKALLARLPAIPSAEAAAFALRAKSIPAPRPGKTIEGTFPPPPGPPPARANETGPVRVVRRAPEGAVALAPYVTVSFSEAMAPVTSQEELAKLPVPVTLTPTPKGSWRWLGTQTVMFQPESDAAVQPARMPMATDYTVAIAEGAKSAGGKPLTPEKWTFATPAPKLVHHAPDAGPQKLRPLLYLEFDQAIDKTALLASLSVEAGRGSKVKLREAEVSEIAEDRTVSLLVERALKGRFVALVPEEDLPAASTIAVRVPKGLKGAEGPKPTGADQTFSFKTFDKFKVTGHRCGWEQCRPRTPFSIDFSNPIDDEAFDPKLVRVEPAVPGLKVEHWGDGITISGRTKGRTRYRVTVDGQLRDSFGQTLGANAEVSFTTTTAEPELASESDPVMVIDPSGRPEVNVFSVNEPELAVKVFAVEPTDFSAYAKWRRSWDYDRKAGTPPGRIVFDRRVRPTGDADDLLRTPVDLTPALKNGLGHAVVVVESTRPPRHPREKSWMRVWAQVTKLGLDLTLDPESSLVWVTELATGKPVSGAEATLGTQRGSTGKDGLARLGPADGSSPLFVRLGADSALLFGRYIYEGGIQAPTHPGPSERFFVFDDRKTYKPGETVMMKGWVRTVEVSRDGDVRKSAWAGQSFDYALKDSRGAEIGKGKIAVDERGEFDFSVDVPKNANTGSAHVEIHLPDGKHNIHSFDVQEFRTPEFEVTQSVSEGPFYAGTHATVTTKASYYAGGGLPNAETRWSVSRADAHFSPPNRSDFAFGKNEWEPWGWDDMGPARHRIRRGLRSDAATTPVTWQGKTDGQGIHRIRVDFDAIEPPYAMNITTASTVTDVNRQAWAAESTLLVHPARVYAGVKLSRNFVRGGEKVGVDVIASDVDGNLVADRKVALRLGRLEFDRKRGQEEVDVATCDLRTTGAPSHCDLTTKQGGQHRLTAIVEDAEGRRSQTTLTVWVLGEGEGERNVQADKLQLVADKKEYKPGDTAEILVIAPFAPAEGLLTLRRGGVVDVVRFSMPTTMEMVRFPVRERMFPQLHVHAKVVGAVPRENDLGEVDPKLPKRPAEATGEVTLAVPAAERTLSVTATPRQKGVEPGGQTTIDVLLRDPKGQPVSGASVAVVVVDEAILALSGMKTPNAVDTFYFDRGVQAYDLDLRTHVKLAKLSGLQTEDKREAEAMAAPAGAAPAPPMAAASKQRMMAQADGLALSAIGTQGYGAGGGGVQPKPIAVRTNFSPLALFYPRGRTDAQGKVNVAVKVPDNLTRYRVMAVASSGVEFFGSGESTLTARLPLMLRPSAPRFLNFGDRFELPVVLQNQTDGALDVSVVARASNAGIEARGKKVKVPPGDRVEVRFVANAEKVGTAHFQFGVAAGSFADASLVKLPVWTPATTEAFATYGVVDQGAVMQPIQRPRGVIPAVGGLEITTSSTALAGLTDAVLYLVRYPYECNEQVSSRVLAIASLKDVLAAFRAEGLPRPEELVETVKLDIERLKQRQDPSGGWGFWFSDPWPYLSIHVAHALSRAKDKGFSLPPETVNRSLQYLQTIENHIPGWYGPEARRALIAYALYVRKRFGNADPARARALVREAGGPEKMGLEALGWILPTLAADKSAEATSMVGSIRRHLQNRMTEQAGAAHFTSSYGEGDYLLLHSDRRVDGILLEALIETEPENTIIPKLVTGLLAHRKAGRWSSTQENAFVLVGLDRYFAKYENVTPDFIARAWLGDGLAAEQAFKGRSTDRNYTLVPMSFLAEKTSPLTVGKDGPGRLYYRVGMSYAPEDLRPPPLDRGFVVLRTYEAVDKDADVRREADGSWRIKAGAKVRTRVTMVAPARRYHVALVDPMPAGFEAMNAQLKVTGPIPQDPNARQEGFWWWQRTWYEHDNLRDERAEAFASLLWEGVHEYVYTSRATTPGTFVVPPPKAEEMYSPEVFGRGEGDRVVIE